MQGTIALPGRVYLSPALRGELGVGNGAAQSTEISPELLLRVNFGSRGASGWFWLCSESAPCPGCCPEPGPCPRRAPNPTGSAGIPRGTARGAGNSSPARHCRGCTGSGRGGEEQTRSSCSLGRAWRAQEWAPGRGWHRGGSHGGFSSPHRRCWISPCGFTGTIREQGSAIPWGHHGSLPLPAATGAHRGVRVSPPRRTRQCDSSRVPESPLSLRALGHSEIAQDTAATASLRLVPGRARSRLNSCSIPRRSEQEDGAGPESPS